jgi:pimeloyl-ACP methyl ester carboxylesterase
MTQALYYHQEGEGAPIVLLHGFLASSHYFKALRKRLSTSHTVVSIDLLGFGKSPKPMSSYTYEEQIAAIHATLARLGISQFVLVGHSLGALVALRYALVYPQQVNHLGLLHPPMYRGHDQALETLRGTGMHYRIMLHSPLRDLLWYGAKTLPRFPFNKRRPSINLTDVLRAPKHARKRTYEHIILQGEFFADIEKITIPTLLVVGSRDRKQYCENSAGWEPRQNITALSVNGGHHFPARQPATTERIIRLHLLKRLT